MGSIITTGGGFSQSNFQPGWQADHVAGYFKKVQSKGKTILSGYRASGRGYPDLSAVGTYYKVVVNGDLYYEAGTSASAPVVAGMISLVNAARLKAGLSSVGWVNPALYALYKEFAIDITAGNNKCNSYGYQCCPHGFEAAEGWDPVTGLGSINFPAFKKVFLSLGTTASNLYRPTLNPTPKPKSPTMKPTNAPITTPPTAKPTISAATTGWVVMSSWDHLHVGNGATCSGPPTAATGYPVGVCIPETYKITATGQVLAQSVMYTASAGTVGTSYHRFYRSF
jgi:tripeptidyl-peptidase-1